MAILNRKPYVPVLDQRAILSSAQRIDPTDRTEIEKARQRNVDKEWQQRCWNAYRNVEVAQYGINWQADKLSKLRLFVATQPADRSLPPVPSTDKRAIAALDRLKRPYGTHAKLIRAAVMNLGIAGEFQLVGLDQGVMGKERWNVYSSSEVVPGPEGFQIVEQGQTVGRTLTKNDFVLRIWNQDPQWSSLATSPMRAILGPCSDIVWLDMLVRATARQRIALAGILKVPSELSFGPTDDTESDDSEEMDPFITELMEACMASLKDEESMNAAMPVIIRGAAEYLRDLTQESLDRPFDEQIGHLLEKAIRRVGMGINLPMEITTGLGDTTHWAASAITQDAYNSHLDPIALRLVNDLTYGFFWPTLEIGDPTAEDVPFIWYDPSEIIAQPDMAKVMQYGHESGAVSHKAWRRQFNVPETDAPDEMEMLDRAIMRRGNVDPFITESYFKTIAPQIPWDRPANQTGQQNQVQDPAQMESAPGDTPTETAPLYPSDSHTVPVESAGFLLGAADAAVRRALDLAGTRLRTKVQKDKETYALIASATSFRVAAILGPDRVDPLLPEKPEDIFEGAFGNLREQFFLWGQRQTIPIDILASAFSDLTARLTNLSRHSLYDPPYDHIPLIEPIVTEVLEDIEFRRNLPRVTKVIGKPQKIG